MRESTERPEAVEAGTAKLVGTDPECIINNAQLLLDDPHAYASMSTAKNPYGDGTSCSQIRTFLENYFSSLLC
jgi:UDP-N-acetylglucosamine 2-epimerase (non-hydrolysing)